MQKVHELKTWPEFFEPILDGSKTFELRHNDRDFRVGDILHLREHNHVTGYSGREICKKVSYVFSSIQGWGLSDEVAILGLQSYPSPLINTKPASEEEQQRFSEALRSWASEPMMIHYDEQPSHVELFEAGAYDNYLDLSISKDERSIILQIRATKATIGRTIYDSLKGLLKLLPLTILSEKGDATS